LAVAAQAVLRAQARPVEQREEDAAGADRHARDAGRAAGLDDGRRDVHGGLVDEVAVNRLAVVAEPFAMIRGDDDRDGPADALLEGLRQPSELLIHERHFAEIGMAFELRAERLRARLRARGDT